MSFAQFPSIKVGNFLLRKITSDDLPSIFEGLSHPQVIQYYGVSYTTMEECKSQMVWYNDLLETETGIWWAICNLDTKIFYGAVGYNNLSKTHRKAEIGYWLLPNFWKKGILSAILPSVLDFGVHSLALHRIEALIETENENSSNAAAKVGFQKEGTMKDCEYKNGRFISLDMYAYISDSLQQR